MLPWVELDRAKVPGGGEFRLMQRGTEFTIFAGTIGLMSSRQAGSEEAMARIAAERIGGRAKARVLIGGLGMGFTVRAALALFGPDADIVVAELVPEIAGKWARGPLAELHGDSLDDSRLTVKLGDVGRVMAGDALKFDAILLDVDNGPEGLTRDANDKLYTVSGLRRTLRALRENGVLAVWSSHTSAPFTKRLVSAGFAVEEAKVRARGASGGERHHIWLATQVRPASRA
jgi:spermidine synthase